MTKIATIMHTIQAPHDPSSTITRPIAAAAVLLASSLALLAQAPANDNFVDRKSLNGASVSDQVSNANATWENTEPNHGAFTTATWLAKTVWWSWRAPGNGVVTIDTLSSTFDTLLAIYIGSSVGALSTVSANDNADDSTSRSLVKFPVTANRIYQIAVDGTASSKKTGDIVLNVTFEAAPSVANLNIPSPAAVENDDFVDRVVLTGTNVSAIGYNHAATWENGEPAHGSLWGGSWLGKTLWWSWKAPGNGSVTVDTKGSTTLQGTVLDSILGIYSGAAVNELNVVAGNDNGDDSTVAAITTFPVIAGQIYQIAVDSSKTSAETGAILLNIAFRPTPEIASLNLTAKPSIGNDKFVDRIHLSGRNVSTIGYNLTATWESGEVGVFSYWKGNTVWWSWTAESSDEATIHTGGSDFDTLLGVYTGPAINALKLIAANDNASIDINTSLVRFVPVVGQTYQIVVDSSKTSGRVGTILLHINQPPTQGRASIFQAFELEFSLEAGKRFQIERSHDLFNWVAEGEPFIATGGPQRRLVSVNGRPLNHENFRFIPVQ